MKHKLNEPGLEEKIVDCGYSLKLGRIMLPLGQDHTSPPASWEGRGPGIITALMVFDIILFLGELEFTFVASSGVTWPRLQGHKKCKIWTPVEALRHYPVSSFVQVPRQCDWSTSSTNTDASRLLSLPPWTRLKTRQINTSPLKRSSVGQERVCFVGVWSSCSLYTGSCGLS